MKKNAFQCLRWALCGVILTCANAISGQSSWIRINQLGYLPNDVKVAVLVTKDANLTLSNFQICDALTEKVVFQSDKMQAFGAWAAFEKGFRLNFSAFTEGGSFFIKTGGVRSPNFRIAPDVYDGTADFLLRYLRQQRCGYNPLLRDSCHTAGGYIVYGDSTREAYRTMKPYPIFGGWHDASDYLQYVPTTATAVFQLLFAYEQNPSVFKDQYDANGLAGANGIPDVIDEAKWGMDWLIRMNPEKNILFNQVCDDRDHRGMRMPHTDTLTYDVPKSLARPVYRVTGEPQGLGKYKNRTVGVSSTAGKFASAFGIGARVLRPFYPDYADALLPKAVDAYTFGKIDTGTCQTAPKGAPYFYEEDNWVDDMALAGTQLTLKGVEGAGTIREEAAQFALREQHSPWMGRDTARHYQFFPFVNLAPYFLATMGGFIHGGERAYLANFYQKSLERIAERGKNNPFRIGTPFIWCSNNYVSAAITQMNLYRRVTSDTAFLEIETAHRDWLMGCNPWGVTMIIGLPEWKNTEGVSPSDPHSAFTHIAKLKIDGGLVDGPIYGSIYGKLIGITLYQPDEYAAFQSPLVVFHDDYGDYSTDEPTMDGTASLAYYFSALERKEDHYRDPSVPQELLSREKYGAINRLDAAEKNINLVFTGHEFADGGKTILKTLKKRKIKASFFLTGDFMRQNAALVKQMVRQGHYVGVHSDKHLLYCDWTNRDALLVTKTQFLADLKANFAVLESLGVPKSRAAFFMPPYEWYNDSIAVWSKNAGLTLVNFTPGTWSNADYTTPDERNYKSSEAIFNRILEVEKTDKWGLNGHILLTHVGANPKRTDKFYVRLDALIAALQKRGYRFSRF